jgi:hypothetical protein
MNVQLPSGVATGVGSLPHRDAHGAVAFVLSELPDLPCIPTLPRRSPAEGMIAQAVVGIRGITVGQYGSLAVDLRRVDPIAPVVTDIDHDAFTGFRTFLSAAAGRSGPVKWQFVGPLTLGLALMRAGVPASTAFDVAVRAVRSHVRSLHRVIAQALPGCPQVVVLDEPSMPEMMQPNFPLAPDVAIDLVSGGLAAVENVALAGIHCCGDPDWASILASGPGLLSLPARRNLVDVAGYLARFLEKDGWIAWGAVPTDGPLHLTGDRPWRELSALWCELVAAGCDPVRLRQQSLITPACGLGLHSDVVARRILTMVRHLADRVHSQAVATRLTIGA